MTEDQRQLGEVPSGQQETQTQGRDVVSDSVPIHIQLENVNGFINETKLNQNVGTSGSMRICLI